MLSRYFRRYAMKKFTAVLLVLCMTLSILPAASAAGSYTDVPTGHWAENVIAKAAAYQIMLGKGGGRFGLGENVTRAEFAAMLTRIMGWERPSPAAPTFADNADPTQWYYADIEALAAHDAVPSAVGSNFRPLEDITREEMAVMLVRALGFGSVAENLKTEALAFTDVTDNRGYIMAAADFGIINGKSSTNFAPKEKALREEAAAMMVRMYERYHAQTDWLHGFYAFSSWPQKEFVPSFDALSLGWSRLEYSVPGGVSLNTTAQNNNEWNIPSGMESAVSLFRENGVPVNLNVFMNTAQSVTLADGTKSNACREILLNDENREAAVRAIIDEISTLYDGKALYSGVTIDFEGLRGAEMRSAFSLFLSELRILLPKGKELYCAVSPVTRAAENTFDGYDYRQIGAVCDKVILMAHDYNATVMDNASMARGFTTTPLTPIDEIYCALDAITDETTGVADRSKIALALSFGSCGWSVKDYAVVNKNSMKPTPEQVYFRLSQPETEIYYSATYRNPYMSYYDATDDTMNTVWYEDERSISDKINLAHMFGVTGVSVWRLGLIPAYEDPAGREIYYNVWDLLKR